MCCFVVFPAAMPRGAGVPVQGSTGGHLRPQLHQQLLEDPEGRGEGADQQLAAVLLPVQPQNQGRELLNHS